MKNQFFSSAHSGETRKVLFESERPDGMMEGYTDNYIKVITSFRPEWHNRVIDWKL